MVLLSMLACFFISLMCVWLEKTTVLFICIQKRVKSIVFAVFIKFCDESGLAILMAMRAATCNRSTFETLKRQWMTHLEF